MTKIVFKDFDEFADAINGVAGRFVPTSRPESDWWVQVVPVGRLAIQQVQIGGASTFAGDGKDRAITIGIPTTASRRIRIDGDSLEDDSFILVREGQPFTFAARQTTRWAGITIPVDHALLAPELIETLNARSLGSVDGTHTHAELPHVTRMKSLISRLCAGDDDIAALAGTPLQAMEEEIIAIASCALETSSRDEHRRVGRPRFSRGQIIAKALALIEESEGQPLLIQNLCDATRVSERTLRNVFQEYFGVGPMRLLKVRQLREIRAALTLAEPGEYRVADLAAHFGVWDFSLFARNYKALYGESPSETLRRPAPRNRRGGRDATWIKFASRKFLDAQDVLRLERLRATGPPIFHARG
jgi:AraC family transcriptional regulator, ethanolamine operon transcriptional activator